MRELGLLDAEADTIHELRELSKLERQLAAEPPRLPAVTDIEIEGPDGPLPLRVYTPPGAGPFRPLLFFHGGGWVVGDLDQADVDCRCLCVDTGSAVISVDYRLAPEHPFPAAPEDCYASLEWLAREAPSLGFDSSRIVVAGDSAGGNLAAAVTLMARERGGPRVARQVLIYPVTDHSFDTGSYSAFAEGYWMGREDMEWVWDLYLGDDAAAGGDLRASVLRATDLSGLPPAVVVTAGCDVLHDEAVAYADRLQAAGVEVMVMPHPGQVHGFWSCGGVTSLPREVNARIAAALDGAA